MSDYYDRQGNPISDTLAWAKKYEDEEEKRVAEDTLPDGKWVSTVWLGLDHSFGEGPPLIFETMVFPKHGDFGELYCARYSTEEEAATGHKKVVQMCLDGEIPEREAE